jgi:hypothetical protein
MSEQTTKRLPINTKVIGLVVLLIALIAAGLYLQSHKRGERQQAAKTNSTVTTPTQTQAASVKSIDLAPESSRQTISELNQQIMKDCKSEASLEVTKAVRQDFVVLQQQCGSDAWQLVYYRAPDSKWYEALRTKPNTLPGCTALDMHQVSKEIFPQCINEKVRKPRANTYP